MTMDHDDLDGAYTVLCDRLRRLDQEARTVDAALAGLERMRDELDAPQRKAEADATFLREAGRELDELLAQETGGPINGTR